MPIAVTDRTPVEIELQWPGHPFFLPLEIFDNTEFDYRTPEEWLELGVSDSTVQRDLHSITPRAHS